MNTWEGQLNTMIKMTEKIVSKSSSDLQKRIDRLSERMILSETNEDVQEREVSTKINKLAESVTALKAEQNRRHEEIVEQFTQKLSESVTTLKDEQERRHQEVIQVLESLTNSKAENKEEEQKDVEEEEEKEQQQEEGKEQEQEQEQEEDEEEEEKD